MSKKQKRNNTVHYGLDEQGRFIVENYNAAKTFSNFFPGVAGLWGIPMWVFYVNRGQCISSFGIESKDKALMEFQPANKAYRLTSLQGFRTFIKVKQGHKALFYEPFQNNLCKQVYKTQHRMAISSHDLTIEEVNHTLGISIQVNYFTLPQEPYAALVRSVRIKNIAKKNKTIEIVDGMPVIIPFGLNDRLQKDIARTVEAWKCVTNTEKKAPYYNLKVYVSDRAQVDPVKGGHFFFSLLHQKIKPQLLDPIVDPGCVFGSSTDFIIPENFLHDQNFRVSKKQRTRNRSLCAMTYARLSLREFDEKRITSFFGNTHRIETVDAIIKQSKTKDFIDFKARENEEIVNKVKNYCQTSSSSAAFNLYCGQTFLDNVLRGGLPFSLDTGDGKVVVNVFSRKHGDPERDYNYFFLNPTYLSQGNGNYRDVNQNRRNDIWFNTDVKESQIVNFLNLIQADGYNPLIVRGLVFSVDSASQVENIIKNYVTGKDKEVVADLLRKGFRPGELIKVIEENEVSLKGTVQEFLKHVLPLCHKHEMAHHGEGFWSDHWTYNLDLIERFLALYPEEKRKLFLEKKVFCFYHNTHHVAPRDQRYVLTDRGPRQYHSVIDKKEEIVHDIFDHKLRVNNGRGPVYFTSLLVKLISIVVNKAATFDPSGIGIEMEAGKPNWYDALNGLPGLTGSSINETLELKRLCLFLRQAIKELSLKDHWEIQVFEELANFISALHDLLATEKDALSFWRRSNEIKEHYRKKIIDGIEGFEKAISVSSIDKFLELVIKKTDRAIGFATDKHGFITTYFMHTVSQYDILDKESNEGYPYIHPLNFEGKALPLFLEGFVHALRVEEDPLKAKALYQKIRKSVLYDKKLKMYAVNADLSKETAEIGRCRVFPAGWLENQSIWSHMEYKLLLELLRRGLYEEFYSDLKKVLIPFLKPEKYGRSILENSSFIVSSAHSDKGLHGRGFVARLSGTTAEWLHIWLIINTGLQPFYVDSQGNLDLTFRPILAKWLFTRKESVIQHIDQSGRTKKMVLPKNTYAFNFLGSTLVVYHNPKRRDTFGKNKALTEKIIISYPDHRDPVNILGDRIPTEYAHEVRDNKIERIDIYLK